MALASVDLGGTNIAAAIGLADGTIIAEDQIDTLAKLGPVVVLERIISLIRRLAPGGVEALGLGVPGLVEGGRTLFLPNLATQWRGIEVASILSDALDCPVYLLNDARMATLGELDYGMGKTVSSFAFFTLGTGIGGGIVIDGHLRPQGGELGHQCIVPEGPLCGCGSRGCLEAVASASALIAEGVRLIKIGQAPKLDELCQGELNRVTPKRMLDAGDPACLAAIERVGKFLGIGIANVVTAFRPEAIVLAGGMAQMGDPLLAVVRYEVERRVKMFPVDTLRIEVSGLGSRAAALGGIALASRNGLL